MRVIVTPYSSGRQFPDAVCAGRWLFVSGQVATDATNRIVGDGDIVLQTRTAFSNLCGVLARAGCSMVDVVKLNTYFVYCGPECGFVDYWEKINDARRDFLAGAMPAATAVRVAGFARAGLLVEVEAMAVVPEESAADSWHAG